VTYAGARRIVDADSHLMEWPGFLTEHADPAFRDAMPELGGGRSRLRLIDGSRAAGEREGLIALGDDLVRKGPKWHAALGAVDPGERSTALDLLGFDHQVVYSSVCAPLFDIADPELRYAAYAAHNRAMAAFCGDDERLLGVAMGDLDDLDRAIPELERALDLGLREVWLPARAPGGRSPGHVDHDPYWARLAEAGVPFVLHVGSGPLGIGDAWLDNGRPPAEEMTGAEIIGSKDFMVVYQPAERFLAVLVLDGVLERFPALHGGAIEMGAGWVPAMLRRLDHAVAIWQRSEPRLGTFERTPSEQAAAQLRFTPYPFEDVAAFISESAPELYLFSSDYPHAEGGRDPLGRFDRALADVDAVARARFFDGNFRDLYPAEN
jgi:predicted TIM-barrel fold metal-dependent hydrolase